VALQYRDRFEGSSWTIPGHQRVAGGDFASGERQNDAQGRARTVAWVTLRRADMDSGCGTGVILDAYRRAQSLRTDAPQSAASAGALSAGTTENHVAN
jgi:hypothetical protein